MCTPDAKIIDVPAGGHHVEQGEEIGMIGRNFSWAETVDPKACNTNPDVYQKYTRDPARTPFQWNDDFNAGL